MQCYSGMRQSRDKEGAYKWQLHWKNNGGYQVAAHGRTTGSAAVKLEAAGKGRWPSKKILVLFLLPPSNSDQ